MSAWAGLRIGGWRGVGRGSSSAHRIPATRATPTYHSSPPLSSTPAPVHWPSHPHHTHTRRLWTRKNGNVGAVAPLPHSADEVAELQLLEQEYMLVFAMCDRKCEHGADGYVSTAVLAEALKEFDLASNDMALNRFLRAACTATPNSNSTAAPSTGSAAVDARPSGSGGASSTSGGAADPDVVSFDAYRSVLDGARIRALQPASLRLELDPLQERVRGKRWAEVPLLDHMQIIGRRLKSELLHYSRGIKAIASKVNEATELIWHEFRGNGLRNMSLSDRRLVQSVALDLFKVLPALLLVMMPGGGVVIGAVTRLLPQALPSTFQGAPQWEKYYQVDALQRDIVRKFRADRVAEREVDDLYLAFVTASDTMWRLPDAAVNPFGDALDDALEHKVDDIQPRSVHDRLTPEQLGIVCTALGIQAEKVMVAWPHRYIPRATAVVESGLQGVCDKFPSVQVLRSRALLKSRVSALRQDDRTLAESVGAISQMGHRELAEECKSRGLYVEAISGATPRAATLVANPTWAAPTRMASWLTTWVALSTIRGYDPVFLALWSLPLVDSPERRP